MKNKANDRHFGKLFKKNNIFINEFIYMYKHSTHTFDGGWEVFITLRVSAPVYITTPRAEPEATTVLDQSVFSTLSESSTGSSYCKYTK